ncbi:transposase [Aquibacillus salsiterrae]|uniref:Transposase n=1 Tax=Aquibacillus salsiterrae TaxID=2950439 RepID=A0A9X3WEP7_9BACI|nr:transposase [Aquibacillus salsiterrae]MDC3418457.1 transposase [Aquibacillus salsiterrae]
MELQLELIPFHYYNTLGFDVELIDYIDHVDDSILLEKIKPLYKYGGRPPVDPRVYFRMHYLYFTCPEVTSFRELCRQLVEPKNQAWRNFIGTPNIKDVPAHSSLSHFRKYVTPELFYEILFNLIGQALKLDDFLQPTLAGIDSRSVYALVNGYKKKRCNCENKETCDCEKTYSDPDAKVGFQRNKANQNKFFIGYRKHSIVCPTPTGPIVLLSIILPPDTADIDVLLPLVEKLKQIGDLKIDYLVADLGYFSAEDQAASLLEHDVAVVTDFKKNTVVPESCSPTGKPECEEGYALLWDGFDKETNTSWFNGDETKCISCPLQGTCDKQFGFSFKENPFFYGPVPQGSELQDEMLRFRKQVELAFAHESNQLDSVLRHKKVPVKTTEKVQSFFIMRDIFRLIKRIIKHVRATVWPSNHVEKIKGLQRQQVEQISLPLVV